MNDILNIIEKQSPPEFVSNNTKLLVTCGSHSYGCAKPDSDMDTYGFCIPPENDVFTMLKGEIVGFGRQIQRFEQWHQVGVFDGKQEYDFTIYSIVKYFSLLMENNPNMLDSLFVPDDCVLYQDKIGKLVRDNRKIFLHRGAYHKYAGYAWQQSKKMRTKVPKEDSKRYEDFETHGFCLKFSTHLVRLMLQCETLLEEGDIDLRRHSDILKSIRAGEWTLDKIDSLFLKYQDKLKKLYDSDKCPLSWGPDEGKIKSLLIECLRIEYGNKDYFKFFG